MRLALLVLLALAPIALATEVPSSYQVVATRADGAAFTGFVWPTRAGDAVSVWLFDPVSDETVALVRSATIEQTSTSPPDARIVADRWAGDGVDFAAAWVDDPLLVERAASGGGSIAGYALVVRGHT